MSTINTISIDYQQDDSTNKGILTIRFNPDTHITFDINLDDLNKSTILDFENITIPLAVQDYYTNMAYQIMTSHIFEYFHYND